MPGIHTADQVAGWRPVVDAVHRFGCRFFLQLFHAGRVSHPSLQPGEALPVAPSPIAPNGQTPTYQGPAPFVRPRELALEEIPNIIQQFRAAAHNALLAGFDGVEIHGANGYLLDQFLRDGSNQRTDTYGGSVANRIRLLLQVTETVADVWGADRVGVRISPLNAFNTMFDSYPDKTFGTLVSELARFGLAYLHVVEEDGAPESGPRFEIGGLRNQWNGSYIVNGNYDYNRAVKVIADGRADFVSFGKLFLANPDLPLRFARAAPLNAPDRGTFYGGDDRGYIDYPFLEEPLPALRRVVLEAGGRAEHLAFNGDRSTSSSMRTLDNFGVPDVTIPVDPLSRREAPSCNYLKQDKFFSTRDLLCFFARMRRQNLVASAISSLKDIAATQTRSGINRDHDISLSAYCPGLRVRL
jgi:N-ethylmaleimide reductase